MKIAFDTIVTTTLVLCALTITGLLVHRELSGTPSASPQADPKPVFIKNWRADLVSGSRIGGAAATVQIMEFGDFECPFCAEFHKIFTRVQHQHLNAVTLTFVHFPLPGHRFAVPAARVADCASNQGRFEAMHDELFDHQEDFGLKPWREMAAAAGVPDLTAFDACIKSEGPIPRVEEGKALGAKLDIRGTPTIVVNGWKLERPPSLDELNYMVEAILAGKSPVTPDGQLAK